MKVLGLLLLSALTVSGLPTAPRSPAEPDACSKECLSNVAKFGQELSILKHPDFSKYFSQLDQVCEVITTARKCLERCGHTTTASNPFSLESLNIVCQPTTQEKIATIKQCLKYIDSNVQETCTKECSAEHTIDEATTAKMDPIVQAANKNCANYKCMARCNIEVTAEQCGKEIGAAFENLLQQVVDTQRKELEKLNLVEAMTKHAPPECNYMYDPSALFGEKHEETEAPANPKEDVKSLYAQAQLQLLIKQLELTEKQDQLIERENAKLDMEMAVMAQKAERAERKFHAQHALPTFVPLDKMPKEPASMEPLASHPSAEEPAQEAEKPQQFPQPMPLEISHEHQQQQQQSQQGGPVVINGMPMEFVPLEAMFMPMEAITGV